MRGCADDVSHRTVWLRGSIRSQEYRTQPHDHAHRGGCKLLGNPDWQKKVFKEVDKIQPDVLTFVIHEKDNYEKLGAGNWLTEILQQ